MPTAHASSMAIRGDGGGRGTGLMLGSALSTQTGAALAALAFPAMGPLGVVAVRQWVAAVVLLAIGRPRMRAFTAAQWRIVLALAVVFATMNLTLYTAIDRLGLGLAVTLEFLGPLGVALAGSRRRRDLICALAAASAVCVLTRPKPSTDYAGIGLALVAAACWACYILLEPVGGETAAGSTGVRGRRSSLRAALRPRRRVRPRASPPVRRPAGGRSGSWGALLGGAVRRRSQGTAQRRGPPLRHLHEREPGLRRTDRHAGARPVAGPGLVAGHCRNRRGERGLPKPSDRPSAPTSRYECTSAWSICWS